MSRDAMVILDAAASLSRLHEASARLRSARGPDDVLDLLAEEARSIAALEHAWAARVDPELQPRPALVAVRSASNETTTADEPSPPPFAAALADGLAAGRPVVRTATFVVTALLGSTGMIEGALALPRLAASAPDADAALDGVLAPLAVIGGLALESARLRARLEVVTRSREVLLASISHDLRNPLNTFAMSAGLIRDDLERNDVDVTRGISLVSRMERATSRMQGLIEDLVEASRIDAHKIDFAIRPERASQLLKDAATAAKSGTSDKGASVVADALEEGISVMADRARTLQLIAKVIAFEAKSTGDGGTIRISGARQGDSVRFTARAMAPDGSAVAPPEEGRGGLALLIARGLAEGQRGAFRVEPGDGLVVTFTLPAAPT